MLFIAEEMRDLNETRAYEHKRVENEEQ